MIIYLYLMIPIYPEENIRLSQRRKGILRTSNPKKVMDNNLTDCNSCYMRKETKTCLICMKKFCDVCLNKYEYCESCQSKKSKWCCFN